MRFHANHVSVSEAGDEYFQISFDTEAPGDDHFDLSGPVHPYLPVQRQFEGDDSAVCYIETHASNSKSKSKSPGRTTNASKSPLT